MTRRVVVSDHAMVRYLERVGGFAIDELRAEIAARLKEAAAIRAPVVRIDGYNYCLTYPPNAAPVLVTVMCPITGGAHLKAGGADD